MNSGGHEVYTVHAPPVAHIVYTVHAPLVAHIVYTVHAPLVAHIVYTVHAPLVAHIVLLFFKNPMKILNKERTGLWIGQMEHTPS